MLNYLQRSVLAAGDSLVQMLKNGKRRVTKKDLKERHPLTKDFLYEFSKDHPNVLDGTRPQSGRLVRGRIFHDFRRTAVRNLTRTGMIDPTVAMR